MLWVHPHRATGSPRLMGWEPVWEHQLLVFSYALGEPVKLVLPFLNWPY